MHLQKVAFCVCALVVFCLVTPYAHAATVKPLALSEADRSWLNEHADQIYFAPEQDYPPFVWSEYGVIFGISHDYLDLLEQQLGTRFNEREPRSLHYILSATQSGEQNIISSLAYTPERSKYLIFTRPYIEAPAIFFTKSGKQNVDAGEIIDRKQKVAVGKGYGAEEYLRNRYADMVLVPFDNDYLVVNAVSSGVVDVGVSDVFSLSYLVKEEGFQNIKMMGETGFTYDLAFAVPASMTQLRNMLDDAIEALPERIVYELNKKWLPEEAAALYVGSNSSAPDTTSLTFLYTLISVLVALLIVIAGFFVRHFLVRHTPTYRELEEKVKQRP